MPSRLLSLLAVAAILTLGGCAPAAGASAPGAPAPESAAAEPTTAELAAAELTTADAEAWLDGLVPSLIEREGIAGAVVSVVHEGEVLTERGYGLADTGIGGGSPVPVDAEDTLFRIGSISKTLTATAVMRLVESGELDLDEPIAARLDFELPVTSDTPITMRHLLSHTAGFEDQVAGVIGDPAQPAPTLREAVSAAPPEQIYEPGTIPAYSNYSNALAAYVVERITGVAFEEHLRDTVLEPIGMDTATLAQPLPEDRRAAMSKGYAAIDSSEVPFEMVGPAPAGAISATAGDMSAFMLTQLGHGPAEAPVLRPDTLDLMHSPALDADTLGGLAAGPRMTLGFFQRDRNGHRVLEHSGDLTAFHARLQLYPDDDTGIFIALNSSGTRAESSIAVRDLLADGFSDRYLPEERPAPQPTATSAEHAAELAGRYLVSRHSATTFAKSFFLVPGITVAAGEAGTLTISAITDPAGRPLAFHEVEPGLWQEVGGQRQIAVDAASGRIGLDAAFTLLPMPAAAQPLGPIAAGSLAVLLLALLLRPIGAAVRWHHRIAVERSRTERRLRRASLVSLLGVVGAGVLWGLVARALLGDAGPPSDALIRCAQLATVLAGLGVVPAVWLIVERRRHALPLPSRRWPVVLGLAVLAAAHLGWVYAAFAGGLLAPSITA